MNIGKFLWGLLIVLVGFVFIGINFGLIDSSIWNEIWRFWPVIIIIVGLSVVGRGLSKTGEMIFNIIIVVLAISLVVLAFNPKTRAYLKTKSPQVETQAILENLNPETADASVLLSVGAGNIKLDGGSTQLIEGEVASNFSYPKISRSQSGKTQLVEINSQSKVNLPFGPKNEWDLVLNDKIPTKLELKTGAVDGKLDLSNTFISDLTIKSGASSYNILFGEKPGTLKSDIDLGASSLKLRVPKSVGLKIDMKSGVSSNNFTSRDLVKSGDVYKNSEYETATSKIDLILKTGASSVELERF